MAAYVALFGSQSKAASAAGVTPKAFRNWLNGESAPRAATLTKLKRAAARLRGDVPTGAQAAVPAPHSSPVGSAPAGLAGASAPTSQIDPSPDDEPADVSDPRPRGLYVVGGLGSAVPPSAASSPQSQRPSPPLSSASAAGADLPGWLKKAKLAADNIKPLTKAEGERLRDSTVRSFLQFWKYADEGISATNARRAEAHIWRKVDREETEILVDFMIARGMQSAAAAQIVRGISNIWNYYAVGLILGPRFVESFRFYAANGGLSL